jgi:FkbM family methyltransferase
MSPRLKYLYRAYRYRIRYDRAEIRFIRQSLKRGQVAVDIGCHKGAYTYWMRRRVGPSGAVYAFEPQPKQVVYLREAFSVMGYDNVELVPMAVSHTCGQLPLYIPAVSTQFASLERISESTPGRTRVATQTELGDAPTVLVDVTTLDAFFSLGRQPPHLIKIDVEGHELSVLEGGNRTLKLHHPILLVECEARHQANSDIRPVFDLLESHGYTGSFFCRGGRYPLADFDPAIHQRLDPNSAKLPGNYANNFAFEYTT